MKYIAALLVAISMSFAACSDIDDYQEKKSSGAGDGQYMEEMSSELDDSAVIATVAGQSITINQVLTSLSNYDPNRRELFLTSPLQVQNYLKSYLTSELLYRQAIKENLGKRPDIQKRLFAFRKDLFVRTLGQEKIPMQVSPDIVKKYIDDNADTLQEVRVSQVFFRADPPTPEGKKDTIMRAQEAHKKLQGGADFAAVVAEYSDDRRSKRSGGDIGYVGKTKFSEDVTMKLFAMKEGEVSEPIELLRGYVIMKVTEAPHTPAVEKIKGRVEITLRKEIFNDYVESLKADFDVKVMDDKIAEITGK